MSHSAAAWGRALFGAEAVTFGSLATGGAFRFPRGTSQRTVELSPQLFTKTGPGRYRGPGYEGGPIRAWRTGQGTAVIPVRADQDVQRAGAPAGRSSDEPPSGEPPMSRTATHRRVPAPFTIEPNHHACFTVAADVTIPLGAKVNASGSGILLPDGRTVKAWLQFEIQVDGEPERDLSADEAADLGFQVLEYTDTAACIGTHGD